MRILTYKRTHIGDPDHLGRFGVNDCMGTVRNLRYEAVIGIGGFGPEPCRHQINGKVTWVGWGPKWSHPFPGHRAGIVRFDEFVLLENLGPTLRSMAPKLAKRLGRGVRYLIDSYTPAEQREAELVVARGRAQASKRGRAFASKPKACKGARPNRDSAKCQPSEAKMSPNQPLERTPPRCALRRRSTAR